MNYLNENKKGLILRIPTLSVTTSTDINNEVVSTLIVSVEDFETMQNEYRGLVQETESNHTECYINNKACSDECEETQYELQAKYSNMNK